MFLSQRPDDFEGDRERWGATPAPCASLQSGLHICRNELIPSRKQIEIGILKEGDFWIFYAVRNEDGETVDTFDTRAEAQTFIETSHKNNFPISERLAGLTFSRI